LPSRDLPCYGNSSFRITECSTVGDFLRNPWVASWVNVLCTIDQRLHKSVVVFDPPVMVCC